MYTLRQVSTGVILQWWQIKEEQIKTKQELFTNYPTLKCVPIYMLETDRECKIKRSWQKILVLSIAYKYSFLAIYVYYELLLWQVGDWTKIVSYNLISR